MAAKSAEQYVEYALKHFSEHHKTAVRVIQELRAAGWLRGEMDFLNHVADGQTITRLTRERDSLREDLAQEHAALGVVERERDEARQEREYFRGEVLHARASAASPEVMRVLKAVERLRNHWNKQDDWNAVNEFHAAADALSASRQPKAQEPRWTTEAMRYDKLGCAVWGVKRGDKWHGPFSADVCHKLADILNAEAAR